MFLRKFWSNKEWICFLFKPGKQCIQDVKKKRRIVSLKSPQPNGHWFLKYVKFLFCLFPVFYGSKLDQWGIQKHPCNQENIFGIVLVGILSTIPLTLIPLHDLVVSPEYWPELLFMGAVAAALEYVKRCFEVSSILNLDGFYNYKLYLVVFKSIDMKQWEQ